MQRRPWPSEGLRQHLRAGLVKIHSLAYGMAIISRAEGVIHGILLMGVHSIDQQRVAPHQKQKRLCARS